MLASCRNEMVAHLFSGFGHPKKGLNKTLILDLHKMLGRSKPYFPTSRWKLVIYHARICKESPSIQTKSLQASQNGDVFNRGHYITKPKTMHFEGQNPPKMTPQSCIKFHSFHSSKYGSYIIWSNYNISPNLYFPDITRGSHGTPNQLQHQP